MQQRADLSRSCQTSCGESNGGAVVGMQRPAEIINRGSLDATPTLLRAALAAGIVTTLGLTLVASVSRRKRDLALLKALGFTKAQLAAATSWQSTMAVAIGAVVGIPLASFSTFPAQRIPADLLSEQRRVQF